MAHSSLATTDLYAAFTFVLLLYCLRRFLLHPNLATSAATASALALAQIVKFVGIYLYPALLIVLSVVLLYQRSARGSRIFISPRQVGALIGLHAVILVAFLNIAFLFDRTFTPLSKYRFRSAAFQSIARIPLVREIPLPVPYPYIQGFDWMSYHSETGVSFGNIALLGQVRGPKLPRSDGFPHYYLVCYALKEPLGMQLLLVIGALWLMRRRNFEAFLAGEFPLLVTAGTLLFMLSLFNRVQIGIRHILPALVIFVIMSGAAWRNSSSFSRRNWALPGACVLFTAISVASYFPHMIPYFNEIVLDRKMAYTRLADSNLDWDQDIWVVEDFIRHNPDATLNPEAPVTGRVVVSANYMAGVRPATADYWMRVRNLKPVAHVGYGHLLFAAPPIR